MPNTFYTPEEVRQGYHHLSSHGTTFKCGTLDLSTPISVTDAPKNPALLLQDVSEFVGFHAVNIRPRLNGFQGYDCVNYEFQEG